ncbi:MAG: BatA domain-containing protein [Candidatus Poribacteria bacterium]
MGLPFLNPWMLFFLPAAGVPIVIHLLNRHRVETIEWGAMYLLRRVIIVRARQLRLEDILLMLLRCLIILLVLLALARPTTKMLSVLRKPDTGVLITLDSSMSMSHRPGVASRFEKGIDLEKSFELWSRDVR